MTNTHKTNFFNTYEDYNKFISFWRTLANNKKATCLDHMLYTILKGNDMKKAFTPVTNETKLRCNLNGNKYYNIAMTFESVRHTFRSGAKATISEWSELNTDWTKNLNDDTKEKLKVYFENNSFKKVIGEE
jgi:hypothetical protein